MEMGGVEKVLLSILNNLDRSKFEMTVCLNLNQGELRNEIPSHVRKVALTKGKEDMSKNPFIQKLQLVKRRINLKRYEKFPQIVDNDILKEKYDIEIGMSYQDFKMVLNSTNKYSKKIAWFHSEVTEPKIKPIVPYILDCFKKFDKIIYCSNRIENILHEEYPEFKHPNQQVIVNAIPIEDIKQKSKQKIDTLPEAPVFLSLGRLHTRKGFHKLIDAHSKLINEGLFHHIVILGEGEEENNLKRQIKDLKVETTCEIKPFTLNPYPYIKNADYFVLSSESEAWPLVVAEALILQKPIIATSVGDVPLMIKNGQTGHLISYTTEDIYSAMKIFLTNEEYVNSIRENLKTIENQFDNLKIFKNIENTFNQLITK